MAGLLEYKCPCCGGVIEFDSASQQMKCPYCDTTFEVEDLKNYGDSLKNDHEDEMNWGTPGNTNWEYGETDGMLVYTCQACGGEIVGNDTIAATSCPFCDNPVIMTGQLSGDLKPDYVIPFKLDKKAAKEALTRHLTGKKLLPKIFKDQNHIEEVKGIYVPYWLFDAEADANFRYRGTKVRTWSDSKYIYTETKFYSIRRAGTLAFENVPADASSKMPDDLMESLEPFDFSQAVDFQTAYLSGYLADRYDVPAEDSINRVNERVKTSTDREFRNTVKGYTTVTPEHAGVRLANGKAKYALYPVWLLTTKWNGQVFQFAMNGQTGKFVGDLPMDKEAFWKWFGGITAAVTAVGSFLFWLLVH